MNFKPGVPDNSKRCSGKWLFLEILKIERDKLKLWVKSVKSIFNDEVNVKLK